MTYFQKSVNIFFRRPPNKAPLPPKITGKGRWIDASSGLKPANSFPPERSCISLRDNHCLLERKCDARFLVR
jgi:hypothetical protein